MGNKSSSRKDPDFPGESRSRSRSFNGISSKFRRNKSPPRERSSSFTDTRPKRGGSFRSSANGFLKSSKNGSAKPPEDVSPSKPVVVRNGSFKMKNSDSDSKMLSSSAPHKSRHFPASYSAGSITVLHGGEKDTLGRDTIRKYLTRKNSNDSPRLTARNVREVTQSIYSEQLADISKRRGMAVQNRDLSLSQASLSRMSTKSKSMNSLDSFDLGFGVANKTPPKQYQESSPEYANISAFSLSKTC